jgi:hypothetical protein
VASRFIVSLVVASVSPVPSPCALGQQVIPLLSIMPLLFRRLYCPCLPYCLVHLLSEVASLYAIVWAPYCLVVAIVSDLSIVITYACY